MANDCLFCRIAAGEIGADVVHDDDEVFAFRDINPQAPVHVLVIPKRHIASAAELGSDHGPLLRRMFAVIAQLARNDAVAADGYRIVTNVGANAGQSVEHLHFHLLGGRRLGWPPG